MEVFPATAFSRKDSDVPPILLEFGEIGIFIAAETVHTD